jgi:hypothetical protein
VSWDIKDCPAKPEEVAEAYMMGTLTKEQATAFEDHYVTCNRCATVLQEVAEYAGSMREAARQTEAQEAAESGPGEVPHRAAGGSGQDG